MITPRVRLVHVGFRLLPEQRKKVKELAEKNNVKEADIYRHIVDDFFSSNRIQNVYDNENKKDS